MVGEEVESVSPGGNCDGLLRRCHELVVLETRYL